MSLYSKPAGEVLTELGTDAQGGLSSGQVAELAAKYGPNKLREKPKKKPCSSAFLDQFKDAMIIILLVAAAVSFGIAVYEQDPMEFFEPMLILLIVVLNAIMGVLQESKAEKALDALKNLSAPNARVIRDGKEQIIDAAGLVPR